MKAKTKVKFLFAYGTLMTKHRASLYTGTKYIKEAALVGTLIDLVAYPGYLMEGNTVVKGELLELTDEYVLKNLDAYEGFHENSPANSLYLRVVTKTLEGDLCYVYVYNHEHAQQDIIVSGDWKNPDATPTYIIPEGS
jgi:gamma-glutamylcyclotransferase (GGCT)/AIG2-like uncharacterized protein YtfP